MHRNNEQCGETTMRLANGTLLNNLYVTRDVIGAGGFGVTYVAMDVRTNRLVAIKEFFPEDCAAREHNRNTVRATSEDYDYWIDKFTAEARALCRFKGYRNIVDILDFFHQNNTAYLVMEYIEGITLTAWVNRNGGKLNPDEVLHVMGSLLEALKIVHDSNLLHMDISPDNVFIARTGDIKLIDFGAARNAKIGDNTLVLKQSYAPVEQFSVEGSKGPWSDVYALGATIYHCATGVLPPRSIDRLDGDRLVPPAQLGVIFPAGFEPMLLRMLAVNPPERYANIDQIKQDFAAFFTSVPPVKEAGGKPPRDSAALQRKIPQDVSGGKARNLKKPLLVLSTSLIVVCLVILLLAGGKLTNSSDQVDSTSVHDPPLTTEKQPAVSNEKSASKTPAINNEANITNQNGSNQGSDNQNLDGYRNKFGR